MTVIRIYLIREDRPYRTKMPLEKVWSIINVMVINNELDGNLVDKIKPIFDLN